MVLLSSAVVTTQLATRTHSGYAKELLQRMDKEIAEIKSNFSKLMRLHVETRLWQMSDDVQNLWLQINTLLEARAELGACTGVNLQK